MLKKLYYMFLGDELDIRERLFRVFLLVGSISIAIAILQAFILQNSGPQLFLSYGTILLSCIVSFVLTFRFHNTKIATILIGLVIIIFGCPSIFFYGGGAQSGATIWMTMGLVYIFLMFSGKIQIFFFILTVVFYLASFIMAYQVPETVIPLASKSEIYFDIMFSILMVGTTIGLVMKFQRKVFDRERQINMEQRKELEMMTRSKDSFFASMSHEIRTPINSIIGLNELIVRGDISDETRNYAMNVQNASKMLLSLVNDILDLSQLEVKRMELVEEAYSTKNMLREVVDIIQVRMTEKQLNFEVEIDRQIPAVLYGDQRRIKQILLNLLSNAAKYTQKGTVSMSCKAEQVGDDRVILRIAVADTGCGIKKEELEYLFDAFKRADQLKNSKVEGTGLGLAITKQLIDLMGGTISVDSIYTQGSVFTVTLEQKVIDNELIGNVAVEGISTSKKVRYNRFFEAPEARILVVDDDDLNLIITTKLLQDTKMTIDTASSAEECIRKTKQRYYNLILMDYMMPDMDGASALKEIRRQENGLCREVPVLLLSASNSLRGDKSFEEAGFDGVLEKPINTETLEEEIVKFIPEELIEYRRDGKLDMVGSNIVSKLISHKRKRIYITTDCVSDLPADLQEKYDIRMLYLYIKTKYGRFQDMKEIDVNNLTKYISDTGSRATSDSATLEEIEKFYAQALTEAEEIIHISLAKDAGRTYEIAVEAAKGFDHVHVVDSGHISGGQGLVVLYAAKLAQDGKTVSEICEAVEKVKDKIDSQFLLPSVNIFYKSGYTDAVTAKICKAFHLFPVVRTVRSKLAIYGTRWGNLEMARRQFLHFHLDNDRKYNKDIIFITHAGCSVKEQEMIVEEVHKCAEFSEVIFSSTCVSNACNTGLGTIGYAVFRT